MRVTETAFEGFCINWRKICKFANFFWQEYKKDWNRPINLFTQSRLLIGILPGALVYSYPQDNRARLAATFIFIIVAAMDFLDGYWARKYKLVTPLGEMLDPLVDKIFASYTLAMLAIVFNSDRFILFFFIFVFIRELIVGGYLIYQKSKGVKIKVVYSGKVKTFIISATNGLIFLPLMGDWEYIVWVAMLASIVASIWSAIDYWRQSSRLKKEEVEASG